MKSTNESRRKLRERTIFSCSRLVKIFVEGPVVILAVEDKLNWLSIHTREPTQKVREDGLVRVHQCTNERPPLLSGRGATIEEARVVEDIRNSRSPSSSSGRDFREFFDDVQSCLVEINCLPVNYA